ncbi:hypothetical protein ACCI49_19210 [Microbulbifer epialgicus]|uniref:Lipoprotein n=1 Tax=Microbulbifer epialgicus TaxID=393907 RepID=A0ABV4P3T2_9GAMM
MGSIFQVVSVLLCLCLTACSKSEFEELQASVTEYELISDKRATACLLTRHVNPEASPVLIDQRKTMPAGIELDLPTSDLHSTADQVVSRVSQFTYIIEVPVVLNPVKIIRDIKESFWDADKTQEVQIIKSTFRGLQESYGRAAVPTDCYLKFNDRVYSALSRSKN